MKRLLLLCVAAALAGCSREPAPSQQAAAPAAKTISITTKSPEALAHLHKGETLFNNLRTEEAAAEFAEALKLDPDFALAHAFHGQATPGPDGLKEIEGAVAASGSASEAERALIEGLAANRRGDAAQGLTALKRVIELAPDDWRGHFALGQQLIGVEKHADAVAPLKKAAELNPASGGAHNMLGYAALRQGDTEGAIKAFTEYARILPQEPNPQDSLGEALLAAGRFKESEAAFQKALDLSPQFWTAHQGIAYAKLFAGDWAGGRAALEKAKAAATRRSDKIAVGIETADVASAQRNTAEALRILDGVDKTAGAQPSEIAFTPVVRAWTLLAAGRGREAMAPIAAGLKTADAGTLSPGLTRTLRRELLRARITAEAQAGDAAAAEKTSAALDAAAAADSENPSADSAMHYGRGELAVARRDIPAARAHFDRCSVEDQMCRWEGLLAAEKARDKAGATAVREQLLKVYQRDPVHLIIRSRVSSILPAG